MHLDVTSRIGLMAIMNESQTTLDRIPDVPRPTGELVALYAEPESRPKVCSFQVSLDDTVPYERDSSLADSALVASSRQPKPTFSKSFDGIYAKEGDVILNTLYGLRYHLGKGTKLQLTLDDVGQLLTLVDSNPSDEVRHLAMRVLFRVIEGYTTLAVDHRVFGGLLNVLDSNDLVLANEAIGCLLPIVTGSPKNCDLLIELGVVGALLKFTQRHSLVDVLRTVPLCVRKICLAYEVIPEKCRAVLTFLPVINKLLEKKSDAVLVDTCSLLMSLVKLVDRANAEELVRAGTLANLVSILRTSERFEVIRPILHILHTVVNLGEDLVQAVIDCQALAACQRLLTEQQFSVHVPTTLDLIACIVNYENCIQAVLDAELVPSILSYFLNGNAEIAIGTILNLTCGISEEQFTLIVEKYNALSYVIELIEAHAGDNEQGIKLTALNVLWGFLQLEKNNGRSREFWQLIEFGDMINCLCELQSDESIEVRFLAVRLIFEYWQVLTNESVVVKVIPKVEVLVEGIQLEDLTDVLVPRNYPGEVLDHLVMLKHIVGKHSQMLDKFINCDGVQLLMRLLDTQTDYRIHAECIKILTKALAGTDSQKKHIANTSAYQTLFKHLRSDDPAVAKCAGKALLTLTSGGPELHQMTHKDVVPKLIGEVDRNIEISYEAFDCVAGCLNNVFCYRSYPVEAQIVKDCLPAIYQLLMQDSAIVQCACWALENISYCFNKYDENEIIQIYTTMYEEGIVDRLLQIISLSGDVALINSALVTIARYSCYLPAQVDCQKILSALKVPIEQDLNPDKVNILWTLANLTRDNREGAQTLIDTGLLPFVMESLSSPIVEVQKKSVLVLYNMLNEKTHMEEVVRAQQDAITHLVDIASANKSSNLTLLAVTVLRLIIRLSKHFAVEELLKLVRAEDIVARLRELQYNEASAVTEAVKQLFEDCWALST